jgi:hypothetical protein
VGFYLAQTKRVTAGDSPQAHIAASRKVSVSPPRLALSLFPFFFFSVLHFVSLLQLCYALKCFGSL